MQPILSAFLTFAAVWLAHLMLWRVRLPQAQLKALLVLFSLAGVGPLALRGLATGAFCRSERVVP